MVVLYKDLKAIHWKYETDEVSGIAYMVRSWLTVQ
jgi:hypothetical protein